MSVGLLIVRVIVGALIFGHGAQKLFGWFGGHGLAGTRGFLASLGWQRGRGWALVAGLVEAIGGLLLALGLLTPLAAAMIVGQMLVASVAAHLPNGLWNTNGGFELPLVYATVAAGLAFAGPGAYSLDEALDLSASGAWYGVGAVVGGLVVGGIALALRGNVAAERHTEEGGRLAA